MEPGVKEYLTRIINTLAVGLLWMAINTSFGIMYDYAFVHEQVTLSNILFYVWFVTSLIGFLWWVIRLWRKPIDFEK